MAFTQVGVVSAIAVLVAVNIEAILHHPEKHVVANKFIVTWNPVPGSGLYELPRTIEDAEADDFVFVKSRLNIDKTTVWCRRDDHRVCILYDQQGSVAGMQVSASRKEVRASKVPLNRNAEPQWFRQTLMKTKVYSTIAYFVSPDVLEQGGRYLDDDTLTAPEGIFLLENESVVEHIPRNESNLRGLNYTKQSCFRGIGQHYFYGLRRKSKCEEQRPYFLLYGVRTNTLHGFGVQQYGNLSTHSRNWFVKPPAIAVQLIAGRSPPCVTDWVQKYSLNTIHVFFIDRPWQICCHPTVFSIL